MYRVTARAGSQTVVLHDTDPDSPQKLLSGSFEDEINVVPQMQFSIAPFNAGYSVLKSLTTEIEVYNTVTGKTEFEGYLRKPTGTMKKSGKIAVSWTADGFMGYLLESVQDYHTYENMDVPDFLAALFAAHNAMTEDRKHIFLGQCDIHDTSSRTTAYRSTLDEIRELLVNRLGGEIRVRRVNGKLYFDYLRQYGSDSTTKIALEKNLQEIEVTNDPTNIITRLIPLGAQLNDETAERLTIASVNGGCIWIDDADAYAQYGTYQCATHVWDDITLPENLIARAREYLQQNNVRKRHYKLTALDLALIGLDVDGFAVGDRYKTENALMGIDEWLRCVRRRVDITDPRKSTLEIGDKTETLTVKSNRTSSYVTYEIPKVESDVLAKAHERATVMLGLGGNSCLEFNTDTGEVLIMNSRDKYGPNTRVWRYNASGWGVSNTGYNGPYTMAATFDSGFVADFITVGTLRSIEIINGENGEFTVDEDGNVTASSITITGGSINNGNGAFEVLPDGTVNASAINITGGSIHITTSSESYDVIELNCGGWSHSFSPLEWKLDNASIQARIRCQAGMLAFYSGADYNSNNAVATAWISHTGAAKFNGLSAETGTFTTSISAPAITYKRNDTWYDLESSINSINNNIQTLWDAVFNSN